MKQLISIIAVSTFLLFACSKVSDQMVDTGIAIGVTTGLKVAVKDDTKRTIIADYIDVGAHVLYTVVGNPTPEELAKLINDWIPANIRTEYPEVVTFIVPLITTGYQAAVERYGNDSAEVRKILNRIAVDLETGAAPYITKH